MVAQNGKCIHIVENGGERDSVLQFHECVIDNVDAGTGVDLRDGIRIASLPIPEGHLPRLCP